MVKVSNISFQYSGTKQYIFRGYSFSLDTGEILAILGPNGSGKTTLIKTLLDLIPISEGNIQINGLKSYVPQNTLSPFDYSVREMVVMGTTKRNGIFAIPNKKDFKDVDTILEKIGIYNLIDNNFGKLSGGQRQMVLIARALISNPDIMILDEPTSALDYYNQDIVLKTIRGLANDGKTIIFSTHCPLQALHISDKVLLVKKEKQSIFGTTDKILNKKNLNVLYQLPIIRGVINEHEIIAPSYS